MSPYLCSLPRLHFVFDESRKTPLDALPPVRAGIYRFQASVFVQGGLLDLSLLRRAIDTRATRQIYPKIVYNSDNNEISDNDMKAIYFGFLLDERRLKCAASDNSRPAYLHQDVPTHEGLSTKLSAQPGCIIPLAQDQSRNCVWKSRF